VRDESSRATGRVGVQSHPSGVEDASRADVLNTTRQRDAISLIDIRDLDHHVLGGFRCTATAMQCCFEPLMSTSPLSVSD
jgi:DNA repair protein RadC